MRNVALVALLLSGGAALGEGAVLAQQPRNLDAETSNVRSFTGRVAAGEELFEVTIPAGTSMRIEAITTSELDPMMQVSDAETGELLAEDDDSGGSLNARVTLSGGEAGRQVRIGVRGFSYEGMEGEPSGGTFELRLTTLVPGQQPARSIGWGQSLSGRLEIPGEVHEYAFTGQAGMLLDVRLQVDEEDFQLDPYLELRAADGSVLASNDDSGGTLDSRVRFVLPDAGPYVIAAMAYGDSTGGYTLSVAEARAPVVQLPLQLIGIADVAEGRVGSGYEEGGVEPAYIDYQLSDAAIATIRRGGSNGEVTIRLTADETPAGEGLDPYLQLSFDTPLGFAVVMEDDDGGGSFNAMIPIDLGPLANQGDLLSRLRIRAMGYGSSEGGYRLEITRGMEPMAGTIAPVMSDLPDSTD